MKELFLVLPTHLKLGKTAKCKTYPVNMNAFRNWHFQTKNSVKQKYTEIVTKQLSGKDVKFLFKNPIIKYKLFLGSRRKADIMNILAMVDKFTCDALVENYVIYDDSYDTLSKFNFEFGGIDPNNPRVEMTILE